MAWHFPRQRADQVEQDITQRDQFSNDDVALSETIIRESVQNSLDAAADDSVVRVAYRLLTVNDGLDVDFIRQITAEQIPHAISAGLDLEDVNFNSPSVLVIEDFGTKGLTGPTDRIDNDHFSDFWRRHGKSHKTGKSRGRWGLGKLVYSTTSEIGVFFGATSRQGDPEIHVMGQTVLALRTYQGHRYTPHAFFADMTSDDPEEALPVPLRDANLVRRFINNFKLEREGEPGLSVIIPFPNRSFSIENMIGVSVENYFYPLITGQLVLRFDNMEIGSQNVRECADKYAKDAFHDIDPLFDFVEGAHGLEDHNLLTLKESWIDDKKLDEDDFEAEDLEGIRSQFVNGQIIGLRLPLNLTKKTGESVRTCFKVFIQKPEHLNAGLDLYVRGGLTVPGERKFGSRKALGAMIADEEEICSFLGDAENAAHTKWIASAEKLKKNWKNPADKVKVIKHAVLNLYDMLAQDVEEEDEKGLAKFFSIPEEEETRRKPRKTPPKPVIDPPQPPRQRVALTKFKDGFRISGPQDACTSLYPCTIKVRAAYEVIRGNAFSKYSSDDFSFGKRGGIVLSAEGSCSIDHVGENRITVTAIGPDFVLQATGFDENRDLKVDVRAEASGDAANV